MTNEKDFEIIVNASEYTVPNDILTFKQIVEIAFPGHPADQNMVFSVTYEHAHSKPHQGTLADGGTVTVQKRGTIFDVTQTNRS